MLTVGEMARGARVIARDVQRVVRRELDFHRARPATATLFLTYRCDSRCRTCTSWKRDPREELKREIGSREWERIIGRLHEAGVTTAEIFGGNVLLRKDLLTSVLRQLHEGNIRVHLPTNQMGLDDETAQTVAECVDAVYISTDGVGGRQDEIRGRQGAAARVDESVAALRRLRSGPGRPRLVCNTTVSKYNVEDLERIAEYACAAGFDEIHFEYAGEFTREHVDRSMVYGARPAPYYLRQDESILVDRGGARRLKENIRSVRRKFRNRGITVVTINIDALSEEDLSAGTVPRGKCYVERNEVTVDPGGDVVACPFITTYPLGSLLQEPLEEIWNNGRHRDFRALQNRGRLEMCRHCILGVQRNPGVAMSLKRIYWSRIEPKFV